MKKHLLLTCISYWFFGFGVAFNLLGVKAGLSVAITIPVFALSITLFVVAVFTSLEKLKMALKEK